MKKMKMIDIEEAPLTKSDTRGDRNEERFLGLVENRSEQSVRSVVKGENV